VAKKLRIKRGDSVEVISGRDRGVRGEVIRVHPKDEQVVVQGVNVQTKHQRQVQAGGRTMSPGIIQFEAPVHISNVMLVCPSCGERTRVRIEREEGQAFRVCRQCDSLIDT
jgi:large subunit ribosomal protein L24